MKLFSFNEYLNEVDKDPELEDEIQQDLDSKMDVCVRCGKKEKDCECKEDDYYSTINIGRIPAGKTYKPSKRFQK